MTSDQNCVVCAWRFTRLNGSGKRIYYCGCADSPIARLDGIFPPAITADVEALPHCTCSCWAMAGSRRDGLARGDGSR